MGPVEMPCDHFPCPACQEPIPLSVEGREIAACSRCRKTWKAGPCFQEGMRTAFANEGWVEMTLWHERIDRLLPSLLAFFSHLGKDLLMLAPVLFVVLLIAGAQFNWLLWTVLLATTYALFACLGRCLPIWFPKDFASTPTAIVAISGLIYLDSQLKPLMIRWSSVIEANYFFHVDCDHCHLAITYRNDAGEPSTIIIQGEDGNRRLAKLYEGMRARMAN
jgi:hypothetical protein